MPFLQWGVIGPQRLFSQGQLYYVLLFFFLLGAILPAIQRALQKKFKIGFLSHLNFPLVFLVMGMMSPATPINFMIWALTGFMFNYVILHRHFNWWIKYNCTSIILY